jgi:hypothetical protein
MVNPCYDDKSSTDAKEGVRVMVFNATFNNISVV